MRRSSELALALAPTKVECAKINVSGRVPAPPSDRRMDGGGWGRFAIFPFAMCLFSVRRRLWAEGGLMCSGDWLV